MGVGLVYTKANTWPNGVSPFQEPPSWAKFEKDTFGPWMRFEYYVFYIIES